MPLDDFDSENDDSSDKFSSAAGLGGFQNPSSSQTSRRGSSKATNWVTKIDFSKPYILVAEDPEGNIYKHEDNLVVLEENTDWRRLDDHPSTQYRVLYQCATKEAWLKFCNRSQEQLGVDPKELLEDDPAGLYFLEDEVYMPPGHKPNTIRECQVCRATSDEDEVTIVEVDLQKHSKTPVCASHTIEELAHQGLLE